MSAYPTRVNRACGVFFHRSQETSAPKMTTMAAKTVIERSRYRPSATSAASTASNAAASGPRYVNPEARKCPPPPRRAAAACTLTRPLERKLTRISPSIRLEQRRDFDAFLPAQNVRPYLRYLRRRRRHAASIASSTYEQQYRPSCSKLHPFDDRDRAVSCAATRLFAKISSVICFFVGAAAHQLGRKIEHFGRRVASA